MYNFQLSTFNSQLSTFNSQLSTLNSQLRVESLASSSWFGGLVLIVLIALALSISAHRKQYALYVRNLINKQGRVMNYDTESTSAWANIFLWFVVVSGFVLTIVSFLNIVQVNFIQLLILYFSVAACLGLKWLLIRFIGYVFGLKEQAKAFSTDYFVIIALFGLLLLIISFGITYALRIPDWAWLILLLFIGFIVLITLFIKLLQIFYTRISSLFYIFLYLCTSEILPLLIALKVVDIV